MPLIVWVTFSLRLHGMATLITSFRANSEPRYDVGLLQWAVWENTARKYDFRTRAVKRLYGAAVVL